MERPFGDGYFEAGFDGRDAVSGASCHGIAPESSRRAGIAGLDVACGGAAVCAANVRGRIRSAEQTRYAAVGRGNDPRGRRAIATGEGTGRDGTVPVGRGTAVGACASPPDRRRELARSRATLRRAAGGFGIAGCWHKPGVGAGGTGRGGGRASRTGRFGE